MLYDIIYDGFSVHKCRYLIFLTYNSTLSYIVFGPYISSCEWSGDIIHVSVWLNNWPAVYTTWFSN